MDDKHRVNTAYTEQGGADITGSYQKETAWHLIPLFYKVLLSSCKVHHRHGHIPVLKRKVPIEPAGKSLKS